MTLEEQEKRVEIFQKYGWICQNCGIDVREHTPQLAHLINQSKMNIKKYGAEVIHHEMNMQPTCSNKCNAKLSLYGKYKSIDDLVKKIKLSLNENL